MHEKTLSVQRVFDGRVLSLEVLDVELEDGRRSVREIIRHVGAVGVVPRLPDGRFILVRQYRKALDAEVVEICAGLIETGETPEETARRELLEETGCRTRTLHRLGALASSPGYTDEKVDVFLADCEFPDSRQNLDADEQVDTLCLNAEDIEAMIRDGELYDAKSVAAWYMVGLHEGRNAGTPSR